MTILVADVGGTNSRLAVAQDGRLDSTTIRRFRNTDYQSFYDVVNEFQRNGNFGPVAACTIALAGPVTAQRAVLTNLEWEISASDLKETLSCNRVFLMNDLTALGHSIGHGSKDGIAEISTTSPEAPKNGQKLVVGLGTGFNVCPVKTLENGVNVCFEAELGHVAPTLGVMRILESRFAQTAHQLTSIEECLSGPGLSRLHALLTGNEPVDAAQIVASYAEGTDTHARETLDLMAELLGTLAKELLLHYLPLDGFYFAGSVARGLFDAGLAPVFLNSFSQRDQFTLQLPQVPVSLIRDDAAALVGCVAATGKV